MQHILEAQQRWKPLDARSSFWDNRYIVTMEQPQWTQPATVLFSRHAEEHHVRPEHWHRDFMTAWSPMTMIERGIFGDAYFGCPLGLHRKAMLPPYGGRDIGCDAPKPYYKDKNFFQTKSGLSRDWWLDKGLIYAADPLGWFEWFCWYWLGRRMPVYDAWQIDRWRSFGIRHKALLRAQAPGKGRGYQQALFQWSHDPFSHQPPALSAHPLVHFGP